MYVQAGSLKRPMLTPRGEPELVAVGMTIGWMSVVAAVAIMALGSALQAAVGIGLALFVAPVLALIDPGLHSWPDALGRHCVSRNDSMAGKTCP
jgi:hypothetical protein